LYESHPEIALEYCKFVLQVKNEILDLLRERRVPLWVAHLDGKDFFDAFPEFLQLLERVEPVERELELKIARTPAVVVTPRTAPGAAAAAAAAV